MTIEEEIKKAIDIQFPKGLGERTNEQALAAAGFELGVEWAYNHPVNVWHDASEKPHAKKRLLVQFDKDDYKTLYLIDSCIDIWCDWCKIFNFIRWAYIDDLLPKGGKK